MFEYFQDNAYGWNQSINMALEGGGNINEIDNICRSLKSISDLSEEASNQKWHQSWERLARQIENLADASENDGNWLSAGRKYLRSSIYYFVAERHLDHLDPDKKTTYLKALATFKKGVLLSQKPVEFVEIPYNESSLPALFIPAPGNMPSPCLIHFDGFDITKEILYLHHVGQEYRRRGISLLVVDHPGVGEALRLRNLFMDPYTEVPAAACVDYLETRSEVVSERIGVIGASLGGYYAPRAAAFEKRISCCVAWGASWEFDIDRLAGREEGGPVDRFQLRFVTGKKTLDEAIEVAKLLNLEGVTEKISCPLLVIHGENDRIVPLWQAEKTIETAINSPQRELKVFTEAEGGAEHCQVNDVSLAVDYAADWVSKVLGGYPRGV